MRCKNYVIQSTRYPEYRTDGVWVTGSSSKQSSAAPAMRFAFRGSNSARSSTDPPRALLGKYGSGFIFIHRELPPRQFAHSLRGGRADHGDQTLRFRSTSRDSYGHSRLLPERSQRRDPDESTINWIRKKFAAFPMGIYEHVARDGPHVRLRELMTNDQFACHSPAGYVGQEGELWYVRLAPPLEPQLGVYWIAMTAPYILTQTSKEDWLTFLKRAVVQFDGPDERTRLDRLIKHGPEPHYWHAFVFKSYRRSMEGQRLRLAPLARSGIESIHSCTRNGRNSCVRKLGYRSTNRSSSYRHRS